MIKAVGSCLKRLWVFSGRDSRATFWPYAITVMIVAFAAGGAIILPVFAEAFGDIHRFAAENPDPVTVSTSTTGYSIQVHGDHPGLMPDFGSIFVGV